MSFLIACAGAVTLTALLGAMGVRLGLVDRPGALKIHTHPIPVTGGPAVVAAVLLGLGVSGKLDPWVAGAACLALVGGIVDDIRPLPVWIRVLVQAAAGALLVAGGLRIEPFGGLGGAALLVTAVACCNAVNMVDGQDGLAAGLGAIAAVGLAGVLGKTGSGTALPLCVAGALAGFLVWNRPPARVFLGDGGAYAVGVLLAASVAQATAGGWQGLLASGACLGVFAYELVSTIARRLASDSPTIRGDRDHSYDRLGDRLGSRFAATLIVWGAGAIAALVGIALLEMPEPAGIALAATAVVVTTLLDVRQLPVSIAKGDR